MRSLQQDKRVASGQWPASPMIGPVRKDIQAHDRDENDGGNHGASICPCDENESWRNCGRELGFRTNNCLHKKDGRQDSGADDTRHRHKPPHYCDYGTHRRSSRSQMNPQSEYSNFQTWYDEAEKPSQVLHV